MNNNKKNIADTSIGCSSDSFNSCECCAESEIEIVFGMEIELTSAYDEKRIKSYYASCAGQFNNESFEKMEKLFVSDFRKFVLYRNIIACYGNGLDSTLFGELFYKTKSLLFVVEEKRKNVWSLKSSSAFVGTKNFEMMINWDNIGIKRFDMEFNHESLLKAFQTVNESFAMIKENPQVGRRKIIRLETVMTINWDENEVEMIQPLNDSIRDYSKRRSRQKVNSKIKRKSQPTLKELQDQINKKYGGSPHLSCLYPKCSYKNFKIQLLEHYKSHDKSNNRLIYYNGNLQIRSKRCQYCKKVIYSGNLTRHFRSVHKNLKKGKYG